MNKQSFYCFLPLISVLVGCTKPTAFASPSSVPLSPTMLPVPTLTPPPSMTLQAESVIQPTNTLTPTPSGPAIYLSDLTPYHDPQNIEGGLQKDRQYWQLEIWIHGIYYPKGLGMHAPESGVGTVSYRVPKNYHLFIALIGLAQQDGNPECSRDGSARFRVDINNVIVFESPVIRFDQTEGIRIPVQGGNILTLEVDNGNDGYTCDHSTWAGARFEP